MTKKFVVFLDILGFKEIVENNSHEDLEKIYSDITKTAIEQSELFSALSELSEKEYGGLKTEVQTLIVSDSILIWTTDDSIDSFCMMVLKTKSFLAHFYNMGMPLRGAITRGEISINIYPNQTNIYGKALTETYTIENQLELSGCIITSTCMDYIFSMKGTQEHRVLKNILEHHVIIKYVSPKKTGAIQSDYVINWVREETENDPTSNFTKHKKNVNSWPVAVKMKNTGDFIKHVKDNDLFIKMNDDN